MLLTPGSTNTAVLMAMLLNRWILPVSSGGRSSGKTLPQLNFCALTALPLLLIRFFCLLHSSLNRFSQRICLRKHFTNCSMNLTIVQPGFAFLWPVSYRYRSVNEVTTHPGLGDTCQRTA